MAASKIKHMYDALLALRSLTDRATAVTATGVGGGFVDLHHIPAGNGTYAGTPGLPGALGDVAGLFGQTSFDVVILVDSIDTTSGTETYTLKLQSVDAAKANPTDVPGASVAITSALVGEPFVLKVSPSTIVLADADAAFLQIAHVLAGATPSMKYHAFAGPETDAA
jgi:hypothetical protein